MFNTQPPIVGTPRYEDMTEGVVFMVLLDGREVEWEVSKEYLQTNYLGSFGRDSVAVFTENCVPILQQMLMIWRARGSDPTEMIAL